MAVLAFMVVVGVNGFRLFRTSQLSISSAHFSYPILSSRIEITVSGKDPPPQIVSYSAISVGSGAWERQSI